MISKSKMVGVAIASAVLVAGLFGCASANNQNNSSEPSSNAAVSETEPVEGIEITTAVYKDASSGSAVLGIEAEELNETFSYGDAVDVKFSNGYVLKNIPYYNGFYAKLGDPLMLCYLGDTTPCITTNYGESMWEMAGLEDGSIVTVKLVSRGAYSTVQDALNITYTTERDDYPTDEAFANFRQIKGEKLNGKLYRSASPVNNWKKRAAYASALAEDAKIAFVLNLSDTEDEIADNLASNADADVDTTYYASLFDAGNICALDMNSSYSTEEYQQKICAGLAVMAHADGPYLVHCVEGKDRTGFTCLLLEALAGSTYDEMLADYMGTYANYCFITKEETPDKYEAVRTVCFDSMIGFLAGNSTDYANAARDYLSAGGMSQDDLDLLVEKLTK